VARVSSFPYKKTQLPFNFQRAESEGRTFAVCIPEGLRILNSDAVMGFGHLVMISCFFGPFPKLRLLAHEVYCETIHGRAPWAFSILGI